MYDCHESVFVNILMLFAQTMFSDWCGWHNDHGSLTGLVPAMFFNEKGEVISNPDPTAGLYVRNRRGEIVKVSTPSDHLAFQIGETAQIHSGGILQATPHAVKGAEIPGCSRYLEIFVSKQTSGVLNLNPFDCKFYLD